MGRRVYRWVYRNTAEIVGAYKQRRSSTSSYCSAVARAPSSGEQSQP